MSVKSLIDEIQRQFPPERVGKSLERFRKIWQRLSPTDPPLVTQSWNDVFLPEARLWDKSFYEPHHRLRFQLEGIIERGCIGDDFIPALTPDDRKIVIPSIFGCQWVEREGESPRVLPKFSSPAEMLTLRKPRILQSELACHVLNTIRVFRESTEGNYYIRTCEIAGPADTASMLMGEDNFLEWLETHPEEIKRSLDLITEIIIEFYQHEIEAAGGNFIPTHVLASIWMPLGHGVAISENILDKITPTHYREFLKPCFEKIALAFGGIVIRSSGDLSGHIETLLETRGLSGLHFEQMNFIKTASLIKGRTVIISARKGFDEMCSLSSLKQIVQAIEICRSGTYAILSVGTQGGIDDQAQLFHQLRAE